MKLLKQSDRLFCDRNFHNEISSIFGDVLFEEAKTISSLFRDFIHGSRHIMARKRAPFNIAIVFSHTSNYWESAAARSMVASLREAYGERYTFNYAVFTANNSLSYLKENVVPHLSEKGSGFDVCVAFTPWIIGLLRDEMTHSGALVPIVFGGIAAPERIGMVGNPFKGADGVTGVVMKVPSYHNNVQTIKDLGPHLDELIIPYDGELTYGGLTERYYGMTESFVSSWKQAGGKVKVVDVTSRDDIGQKIVAAASPSSLINLSNISSVITQTDTIVKACNAYSLPVYAHNRQGVRRGAVFGSGGNGDAYGPSLAYLVGKICVDGVGAHELPLAVIDEPRDICYLEPALKSQGFVDLDQASLRKMRMLPIHHVE